ncbi:hypothetical protein BH09PAT4_BH09PAT4_06390 [soil metagenome]
MATKKKTTKITKRPAKTQPNDGAYLLKLVMYTIVGTQWLWFETSNSSVPVPIGLLIGLVFAMHEHFRVDRKIEFAVLLAAMLAGFVAKVGLFITI